MRNRLPFEKAARTASALARWVTSGTHYGTGVPVQWTIRQTYDARTMAPLGYDMNSGGGGYTRLRIDGLRVQGTRRTTSDAAEQVVDLTLDRSGFIASASDLVPVAVGLKRGSVMIAPVWGPAMTKAEDRIFSVLDEGPINVEGTEVRAWKVEERRRSDGRFMATWYLTTASPCMVYGEVPLPNGRTQRMSEVAIPMPPDR